MGEVLEGGGGGRGRAPGLLLPASQLMMAAQNARINPASKEPLLMPPIYSTEPIYSTDINFYVAGCSHKSHNNTLMYLCPRPGFKTNESIPEKKIKKIKKCKGKPRLKPSSALQSSHSALAWRDVPSALEHTVLAHHGGLQCQIGRGV